MRRVLIFGPPGTGKTSTLIALVKSCGVDTVHIAYVLFGKAASDDVRVRVGAPPRRNRYEGDDFPWFRTIHSMAFALLGLQPEQVMGPERWDEFGDRYGYKFTNITLDLDGRTSVPLRTKDDELRALYDWARNRKIGVAEALTATRMRVSPTRFRQYVARLEAFKKAEEILDFTDMIVRAIDVSGPAVDIAFIDEAQDLSPLEWDAVSSWFGNCPTVYIGGDDDQCLFGFKAAEPSLLVGMADRFEMQVLTQSYRLPRAVHDFAQQIILRNKLRVSKTFSPRTAEGSVELASVREAMRGIDPHEKTLVLARNRHFLEDPRAELRRLAVPFRQDGISGDVFDPESGLAVAFKTMTALSKGHCVTGRELKSVMRFVPSTKEIGLIPHGFKTSVEKRAAATLSRTDVEELLEGAALLRVVDAIGPAAVLKKAHRDDISYVDRVFAKFGDQVVPKVTLTTIHASKGGEANTVVVIPDVTKATFAEMQDRRHGGSEAENRVAYVAATRAMDRLVITRPQTQRAYPYPTQRRRAP